MAKMRQRRSHRLGLVTLFKCAVATAAILLVHHICNLERHTQTKSNYILRKVMPQKMSLVMVNYHDTDMMVPAIKAVAPYVAEIIFIDGPRKAMVEELRMLGLFYDASSSPLKAKYEREIKPLLPNVPFLYHYQVWEDEAAQRNFAFRACNFEVMLQLEGDFLINIDEIALHGFLHQSNHPIASVAVSNLARPGIVITPRWADIPLVKFPLIVKRSAVTAEQYFSHLWIVGSKATVKANASLMYGPVIGNAHHYTLLRSNIPAIIKYVFYTSLHAQSEAYLKKQALIKDIARNHGVLVAREAYMRTRLESALCMPSGGYMYRLPVADKLLSDISISASLGSICSHSYIGPKLLLVQGLTSWAEVATGATSVSLHLPQKLDCRAQSFTAVLFQQIQTRTIPHTWQDNVMTVSFDDSRDHTPLLRAIGVACDMQDLVLQVEVMR